MSDDLLALVMLVGAGLFFGLIVRMLWSGTRDISRHSSGAETHPPAMSGLGHGHAPSDSAGGDGGGDGGGH